MIHTSNFFFTQNFFSSKIFFYPKFFFTQNFFHLIFFFIQIFFFNSKKIIPLSLFYAFLDVLCHLECSKKFSPKIFLGEARRDTMLPSISSFLSISRMLWSFETPLQMADQRVRLQHATGACREHDGLERDHCLASGTLLRRLSGHRLIVPTHTSRGACAILVWLGWVSLH